MFLLRPGLSDLLLPTVRRLEAVCERLVCVLLCVLITNEVSSLVGVVSEGL